MSILGNPVSLDTGQGNDALAALIDRSIVELEIPEGVTAIGSSAFRYCAGMKRVVIPYGVTSIGMYAFDQCGELETVEIPDSVTSMGIQAFGNCGKLKTVKVSAAVTAIANNTFGNCQSLERVYLPAGIQSILSNAFYAYPAGHHGTLYCGFAEGAVSGAPWGWTGTIVYNYSEGET